MKLTGLPYSSAAEIGDSEDAPLLIQVEAEVNHPSPRIASTSTSTSSITSPPPQSNHFISTEKTHENTNNNNAKEHVHESDDPSTKTKRSNLVPPLLTQKSYGSIDLPSRRASINPSISSYYDVNDDEVEEDEEDDEDESNSGGFASEAGWSARRTRRLSARQSESCIFQYIGIIFTLCYAVCTSLSGLTVKLLQDDFHPFNICLWRFITIFSFSGIIISYTKIFTKRKLMPKRAFVQAKHEHLTNTLLLLLRGILGSAGRMLYIFSLTLLSLSDANVIASSSPVFMTFFAYFLLGESLGFVPVIIAIITLVGVGIITRPPFLTGSGSFDPSILAGAGTGFGSMVLTALAMIVMRRLRHVNAVFITFSFASCGAIISLVLSLHSDVLEVPSDSLKHAALMIASGGTSFFGQTFLTLGLKYESAGVVALLTNFSVVFSFIFEYIFLGIAPDVFSLSGGFIVVFCIVLITFRKWIGTLPEYHQFRKRFAFLLF